ncbi:MAG: HD domain-containing protein [Ktedonobacteraceae bacterium]|nr:HD domain-containing protein [Chloroflexota bacterium]
MEIEVVQAVAQHAEETLGKEGFRYISAVVANSKMLALELEAQEDGAAGEVDMDALVIASYLHDISTTVHGYHDHHLKSAAMAAEFLRELDVPDGQVTKVEQIILAHTSAAPADEQQEGSVPLEARILYDADKLGRLSGLAVVTSLIEFGARYPNRAVTGEVLATILRHIEERFVDLYQSLNTVPAREMAREKFGNTLSFLDGVIEHLSDATPV